MSEEKLVLLPGVTHVVPNGPLHRHDWPKQLANQKCLSLYTHTEADGQRSYWTIFEDGEGDLIPVEFWTDDDGDLWGDLSQIIFHNLEFKRVNIPAPVLMALVGMHEEATNRWCRWLKTKAGKKWKRQRGF